jgi:hypothetical protein
LAIDAGTVFVNVKPDTSAMTASGSTGIVGSMAKAGALAGAAFAGAAVVGVAKFAVSAVQAAAEAEKVTAQTAAVIKSMGLESVVTASHVANLSEKLALMAGVDDEAIQAGQNMLLTFKNVAPILDEATKLTLDLSVAMGKDMSSSAIMVGKALNDPVKGLSAMSRVGIQFTKVQEKMITDAVKHGDTLKAQKVIMAELRKQFGGSARAQANGMERVGVAIDNVKEDLGKALLPMVNRTAKAIGKFVQSKEFQAWLKDAQRWIKRTAKQIEDFVRSKEFQRWMKDAVVVMKALIPVIIWVGKVLITNFATQIKIVMAVSKSAINVFQSVKSVVVGVWGAIKSAWSAAPGFFSGIWEGVLGFFNSGIEGIKAAMNNLISAFNGALEMSFGGITIGGKTLGAFSINPPDIPSLASGGVVTQPTLAMIGEAGPEAVVPLGGGMNIRITDSNLGVVMYGVVESDKRYQEGRARAHR